MALQYNDEMKEMITTVLEEAIEWRSLFYQPLEKIHFEGAEYQPGKFLDEVKKRNQVGEKILQYIHNQASSGLEEQLQNVENPEEPLVGDLNPDGSETIYSIKDMVTSMENQTGVGNEWLLSYLRLNLPEMLGFVFREIKTEDS